MNHFLCWLQFYLIKPMANNIPGWISTTAFIGEKNHKTQKRIHIWGRLSKVTCEQCMFIVLRAVFVCCRRICFISVMDDVAFDALLIYWFKSHNEHIRFTWTSFSVCLHAIYLNLTGTKNKMKCIDWLSLFPTSFPRTHYSFFLCRSGVSPSAVRFHLCTLSKMSDATNRDP